MRFGRVLFAVLGTLCFGLVVAEQSTVDTLRIVNSSGRPGDTLAIPVSLVNTFDVSAASFRIVFDARVVEPIGIHTEETRVAGIYNKFGERFDEDEGWLYWFGLNFDSPNDHYISAGSGVIANFICRIKADAPVGVHTNVHLEDGVTDGQLNALSDRRGNMVLPVLDGGMVQIVAVGIEDRVSPIDELPLHFSVRINPSPFSDETAIYYAIPGGSSLGREVLDVSLRIYDINGRLVRSLLNEDKEPGYYTAKWDGRGDSGEELPSGVYFLKTTIGEEYSRIGKLVIVR